jgi:hypothetical protein
MRVCNNYDFYLFSLHQQSALQKNGLLDIEKIKKIGTTNFEFLNSKIQEN